MFNEEALQKKWESLTFTDNFIFSHVMHRETAISNTLFSKIEISNYKFQYLGGINQITYIYELLIRKLQNKSIACGAGKTYQA